MGIREEIEGITPVNIMGKEFYMMITEWSLAQCTEKYGKSPYELIFGNCDDDKTLKKNERTIKSIDIFFQDNEKVVFMLYVGLQGFYNAYQILTKMNFPFIQGVESPTSITEKELIDIISMDFKTLQNVKEAVVKAYVKLYPHFLRNE